MNIHQILESRDLFSETDLENYYNNKNLFYRKLAKNPNVIDTILDVINEDSYFGFLLEMESYTNSVKINVKGDNYYIHLTVIPVTQYNISPFTDINTCLKNQILTEVNKEIRNILAREDVSFKTVPFLLPMSLAASYGNRLLAPITQAIKCDLEEIDFADGARLSNKRAQAALDEIGADDRYLVFDSNIVNNSVLLLYSLSTSTEPPVITSSELEAIEDSLAFQYQSLVDGYKGIIHRPTSINRLSMIEVASSVFAYIDKYDIDEPSIEMNFTGGQGNATDVSIMCRVFNTKNLDTPILNIDFKIKNHLHLPMNYIQTEIENVIKSLKSNVIFSNES